MRFRGNNLVKGGGKGSKGRNNTKQKDVGMCGKERQERQTPPWAGEEACATAKEGQENNNHLHNGTRKDKQIIKESGSKMDRSQTSSNWEQFVFECPVMCETGGMRDESDGKAERGN